MRHPLPFVQRVEVFYPDPMGDDDIVAILCPYLTKGGKFLCEDEKCRTMHRLLKGSTIRFSREHALLQAPLWLWNVYLRRSAEVATGTQIMRTVVHHDG